MTAYIRFCSSQMSAAALLQKLVETRPEFDSLLRQCQSHGKVQGMPLSFYLLKPVKRVTEYPLLVEKILNNTPASHPDYIYTQEALNRSRVLCDQVNEGMRMKENSERLEWLQIHVDLQSEEKTLQEKITFNSLTNSVGPRKFLHCGVLKKTKSEKELVCFLFNDFILLTYTNNTSFNGHQFSFDKHHSLNLKIYRQVRPGLPRDTDRDSDSPDLFTASVPERSQPGRQSQEGGGQRGLLSQPRRGHAGLGRSECE